MLSFCCVTAAVGLFLKCRDFFHRDFKNSSVGTEAASGGISRNLSEQRSAFGRGRPRARSRAGIQAGTLCCRLCAVLRCPRDPCLVPTPPSATRGGSVHPVLFAISLCAVGQALHCVTSTVRVKSYKSFTSCSCNWKLARGASASSSAASCPVVAEPGVPLLWFLCSWPSFISTVPVGVFRH